MAECCRQQVFREVISARKVNGAQDEIVVEIGDAGSDRPRFIRVDGNGVSSHKRSANIVG